MDFVPGSTNVFMDSCVAFTFGRQMNKLFINTQTDNLHLQHDEHL